MYVLDIQRGVQSAVLLSCGGILTPGCTFNSLHFRLNGDESRCSPSPRPIHALKIVI